MKEKIHLFDKVGDRYEFYYNENKDSYYVLDKYDNKKNDLVIKYRKYSKYKDISEIEEIRFWFPKPHNFDRDFYKKPVYKIKFELFGVFDSKSGSQLKLSVDDCKNIILKKYKELGYLMRYTDMHHSKEPLIKKVYWTLSVNGGAKRFYEITNELGLNTELYYADHKGVFLKSSYEFIFFCILHRNGIEYEYEKVKVKTYIPDFFIPSHNILIEILGLYGRDHYFKRTFNKNILYKSKGYNYEPIIVDRHNPRESIFECCKRIFGELVVPNYIEYYQKYFMKSDKFIENLKSYLIKINDGKLKVNLKNGEKGFIQKYPKYYEYVINNYGNVQIAIKELIGIPSTKFKAVKIEQYWKNIQYVKDEIENVFKNEKRIPTKRECLIKYRKKYNIYNLYRFWGGASLNDGGIFYEFIEELKLIYGFKNIEAENILIEERERIRKENEIFRIVKLIYKNLLPINGSKSLFTDYRWIYNFLKKEYGGVFFYIKTYIGYPPSHILRPKGYYQIEENVKYELEENWKKFKRILTDSERTKDMGKTNTYYNMIGVVGIKEFKNGGKYYKFIEELIFKYGYDDSRERAKDDFNKNLITYLKGINDGEWDTKKKSSKVLGEHSKYLTYVHNHFESVFNAVNSIIGFPSPKVVRYHKYYDDIRNCKKEIINVIKIYGYLPMHSDLNHKNIPHKNILKLIYAKYKIKEFKEGGMFYEFIESALRNKEK